MPYTRTQADALLTQAEMKLFDESRANPIRKLDGKALASRVDRSRKLRDKARDQLQRQKLASRSRTGSKRGASGDANRRSKDKAELLADILKRFEVQAKAVRKQDRDEGAAGKKKVTAKKAAPGKPAVARKAAAKKAAAKKSPAGKPAASKKAAASKSGASRTSGREPAAAAKPAANKSAAKKAASKHAASKKAAPKKSAPKKAAPKKATKGTSTASRAPVRKTATGSGSSRADATGAGAGAKPGKRARKSARRPISPEQALANTRALLEAKKRHDREGPAWQHIDGAASPAAGPYQSPEARSRAVELHAGESRMTAIEGSISTRERKNQAKRDKR
jgi:hypothetical protein